MPRLSSELKWKQCQHCNQWMCNPRRPMYCTNSCSVAARLLAERKRRAARSKSPRPRTCAHCDRDLGSLDIKRQICDSCRAVARRKCRGKHSRRARHYSVEYETVDARKVYARDKWRCGICNRKVDKRLVPPHPMSASLDHVVPMSLGGAHTYANTQCTHWICNTRKGTRAVGEQLALIG